MIVNGICQPICGPSFRSLVDVRSGGDHGDAIRRIFASGAQGGWYDPSDITTLFQDSAGTTPVTASGQPVGRMLDKSGRGNHFIQATAAARPTYTEAAGLRYLAFDGVDDTMSAAAFNLSASALATVASGIRRAANAVNIVVEHSVQFNVNAGSFVQYYDATGALIQSAVGTGPATATQTSGTRVAPETLVFATSFNLSGATAALSVPDPTINGASGGWTPSGAAAGGGNFGSYPLFIGGRHADLAGFTGNLYGLIVVGGAVSAANRTSAERYLMIKSGISF